MTLTELEQLLAAKKALIRLELENGDWHGVRDLAADIEVLEARIAEREQQGPYPPMSPEEMASRIIFGAGETRITERARDSADDPPTFGGRIYSKSPSGFCLGYVTCGCVCCRSAQRRLAEGTATLERRPQP